MVDEQPVDFEQLPALVVREASQQVAQQKAARPHVLHHLLERRLPCVNRSERQLELHAFKGTQVLARTLENRLFEALGVGLQPEFLIVKAKLVEQAVESPDLDTLLARRGCGRV